MNENNFKEIIDKYLFVIKKHHPAVSTGYKIRLVRDKYTGMLDRAFIEFQDEFVFNSLLEVLNGLAIANFSCVLNASKAN